MLNTEKGRHVCKGVSVFIRAKYRKRQTCVKMCVCLVPCLTPNKPDRQKGQNKSEMHRISQTGQNYSCLSYSAPLSQAGISQTGTFWGVWLIPWSMDVWLIPCPVEEKGVWLIPWSEFWLIPWSCLTYYCHPVNHLTFTSSSSQSRTIYLEHTAVMTPFY